MTNNPPPTILSHVSIGTNDFERALGFYDAVLGAIGIRRLLDHPGAVAYGRAFPEFWVQTPIDGQPASVGNGTHFAFLVQSERQVRDFFEAALAAGATDDGAPGPRPDYGPHYFGCFVRDFDGHKIEAMHWSGPTA